MASPAKYSLIRLNRSGKVHLNITYFGKRSTHTFNSCTVTCIISNNLLPSSAIYRNLQNANILLDKTAIYISCGGIIFL